jgi:hypothetical protein
MPVGDAGVATSDLTRIREQGRRHLRHWSTGVGTRERTDTSKACANHVRDPRQVRRQAAWPGSPSAWPGHEGPAGAGWLGRYACAGEVGDMGRSGQIEGVVGNGGS